MLKFITTVFICLFVVSCTAQKASLFLLNADKLKANKSRILNKDAELLPAYTELIKDAAKAMSVAPFSVMEKKNLPPSGDRHDYMSLAPYHWPDPTKTDGLPYIRKDGQTNPEVKEYKDKEYMPKLCEMVSTLGLAYYFSSNEAFADHASELVKTWFLNPETKMNPNLNFAQAIRGENTGRGAGIIDSRHFIKLIEGINLLKGAKKWTKNDQSGMQKWFADYLTWMQSSENGQDEMKKDNNHGTWYDGIRLSLAMFSDSTTLAKQIIENVKLRLAQQMDEEGKFPKEMERTTSLHYNLFNLDAFFLIATMSDKMGIDLWNYQAPNGRSLKKGFDFMYPYITKRKAWTSEQIKDFDFSEGYDVLMKASDKYKCGKCIDDVEKLAGDDAKKLRLKLLY
jgi:hypothetical protein